MIRGFVLVNTQIGQAPAIAAEMRAFHEVLSADVVIGPYDVVAIISVPDTAALNTLVNKKIHEIEGVKQTITMLSIES